MKFIPKEIEYRKPYKFYLICDKLCNLKGVEVKNKMIYDAKRISKSTFLNNCAYSKSLMYYEMLEEQDPDTGYFMSKIEENDVMYVQSMGFEFIFMKDYEGGHEYWLSEMWTDSGKWIYESKILNYSDFIKNKIQK